MSDTSAITVYTETEELANLLHATNKEKVAKADVAKLRGYLEKHPELWRVAGDVARLAAQRVMGELTTVPAMRESLEVGWRALQDELGYQKAPALERLLIEQVALCWLRQNIVEMKHSHATTGQHALVQGEYWDKCLSSAQRRYLRACETLARVRKLTLGTLALQVNIAAAGGQQVNVMDSSKSTSDA